VKVDSHGNKIWEEVCGNGTYNSVEALFDRGGGASLVVGRTETGVSGRVFVVEFDDMGRIRWQRFYGGDSSIWVRRVIETADGGYLVVGDLQSVEETPEGPQLGDCDAYLLKIDSHGDNVMDGAYGWSWFDVASDAVEIRAGEYIVVGKASPTWAREDAWVFKIKMPVPESGGFPTIAYVALLGFIPLTAVGLAFVARLSSLQHG